MKLFICDICGHTLPYDQIAQVTAVITNKTMQETYNTHYHLSCFRDNIHSHLEPIEIDWVKSSIILEKGGQA